jgi:hypothetical protein
MNSFFGSTGDALDDIKPEPPLPFWLKATVVVLAIPIANTIFPGTVAGVAMFFGLPDPAEIRTPDSRGQ